MSDRRLTPANAHVVAAHLPDDGSGRARVTARPMQIGLPLVDLLRAPDGPRDRQLLLGDPVDVYDIRDGMAFVQAHKDGYVGYLPEDALIGFSPHTHFVSAPATHLYTEADLKSPDTAWLSFGALVTVTEHLDGFAKTDGGFIPQQHLRRANDRFEDPLVVAALFTVPSYLWGGNSRSGVDCSGVVQAACLACGISCPGDSDQQQAMLGQILAPDTVPRRGDLLFWKGHVAWVVSSETILHANAHSMSTTYEDLARAVERIDTSGDGPVTAHKRL